jgi:Tol biopolymer transport system component
MATIVLGCGGSQPIASIAGEATPTPASPRPPSIAPASDEPAVIGAIAFTRGASEAAGTVTLTVNPDGSGEAHLYLDGRSEFPRWSPDGSEIQINCCDDGLAAHLLDPATGELRTLPQPDARLEMFCGNPWFPDGSRIGCEAFGVDDPKLNGIYSIRASDGGGLRRITSASNGDVIAADFSPDGAQLLFLRQKDDASSVLFATDLDGSHVRRISPPDLYVDGGAWSPDGQTIVFEVSGSDERFGELWLVNADGTSPHELAITPECGGPVTNPSGAGCFDPGWSPDGSQIVFARVSSDGSNIYIVNADGTGLVQVTSGGRDHQPDWGMPAGSS